MYRQIGLFLTLLSFSALLGTDPAASSSPRPADGEILVAAAVSLKEAFTEIAADYHQRTGAAVAFTFGSSGELEKQIEAGAPIDVFASAGEKEIEELRVKQMIDLSTQADFARNSLVLIVPAESKLQLHSFEDLAPAGVAKIAVGNPKTVPAGRYAREFLENARLWWKVESRLVQAENVRQVLDYVDHGEVDAGIVYATDVAIAHGSVTVAARAPEEKYGPVLYPIAVVKSSNHAEAARQFVDLVCGPEGAGILKKYGFLPPR